MALVKPGIFGILITVLHFSSAYNIWPKPKNATEHPEFLAIDPFRFGIVTPGDCGPILSTAAVRFLDDRLFVQDCRKVNEKYFGDPMKNFTEYPVDRKQMVGNLTSVVFKVTGPCDETIPGVDMDESYTIQIKEAEEMNGFYSAVVESKSVWGGLRGFDTFSQMIEWVGKNQFIIHLGEVQDSPRFSFRGILIDTSRHYIPMHHIYQTLDAMEMNKFNVLHWHIVDDPSFPFVSETFPNLSKKGAYRPSYVYTPEDVQNVLDYAHVRGIRVLPEFDTPGHTQSWGLGQPGLLTECYDENNQTDGTYGPINPILNSTYVFIDKLYREIVERFPNQYVHLGGDEVSFKCWQSNPSLRRFMQDHDFGDDYSRLESYYIQKLVAIVENLNRSYIVWQEVFDNGVDLKPETLVHVWKHNDQWPLEVKNVTRAGFHVLVSACWYINYINTGADWQKFYLCDPQQFNGTEEERKLVVGGEATMWSEFVDGSNVISRTWPRANAIAERLWSDAQVTNITEARTRFHTQRCRMQLLGIKNEPADGSDFCWCDKAL